MLPSSIGQLSFGAAANSNQNRTSPNVPSSASNNKSSADDETAFALELLAQAEGAGTAAPAADIDLAALLSSIGASSPVEDVAAPGAAGAGAGAAPHPLKTTSNGDLAASAAPSKPASSPNVDDTAGLTIQTMAAPAGGLRNLNSVSADGLVPGGGGLSSDNLMKVSSMQSGDFSQQQHQQQQGGSNSKQPSVAGGNIKMSGGTSGGAENNAGAASSSTANNKAGNATSSSGPSNATVNNKHSKKTIRILNAGDNVTKRMETMKRYLNFLVDAARDMFHIYSKKYIDEGLGRPEVQEDAILYNQKLSNWIKPEDMKERDQIIRELCSSGYREVLCEVADQEIIERFLDLFREDRPGGIPFHLQNGQYTPEMMRQWNATSESNKTAELLLDKSFFRIFLTEHQKRDFFVLYGLNLFQDFGMHRQYGRVGLQAALGQLDALQMSTDLGIASPNSPALSDDTEMSGGEEETARIRQQQRQNNNQNANAGNNGIFQQLQHDSLNTKLLPPEEESLGVPVPAVVVDGMPKTINIFPEGHVFNPTADERKAADQVVQATETLIDNILFVDSVEFEQEVSKKLGQEKVQHAIRRCSDFAKRQFYNFCFDRCVDLPEKSEALFAKLPMFANYMLVEMEKKAKTLNEWLDRYRFYMNLEQGKPKPDAEGQQRIAKLRNDCDTVLEDLAKDRWQKMWSRLNPKTNSFVTDERACADRKVMLLKQMAMVIQVLIRSKESGHWFARDLLPYSGKEKMQALVENINTIKKAYFQCDTFERMEKWLGFMKKEAEGKFLKKADSIMSKYGTVCSLGSGGICGLKSGSPNEIMKNAMDGATTPCEYVVAHHLLPHHKTSPILMTEKLRCLIGTEIWEDLHDNFPLYCKLIYLLSDGHKEFIHLVSSECIFEFLKKHFRESMLFLHTIIDVPKNGGGPNNTQNKNPMQLQNQQNNNNNPSEQTTKKVLRIYVLGEDDDHNFIPAVKTITGLVIDNTSTNTPAPSFKQEFPNLLREFQHWLDKFPRELMVPFSPGHMAMHNFGQMQIVFKSGDDTTTKKTHVSFRDPKTGNITELTIRDFLEKFGPVGKKADEIKEIMEQQLKQKQEQLQQQQLLQQQQNRLGAAGVVPGAPGGQPPRQQEHHPLAVQGAKELAKVLKDNPQANLTGDEIVKRVKEFVATCGNIVKLHEQMQREYHAEVQRRGGPNHPNAKTIAPVRALESMLKLQLVIATTNNPQLHSVAQHPKFHTMDPKQQQAMLQYVLTNSANLPGGNNSTQGNNNQAQQNNMNQHQQNNPNQLNSIQQQLLQQHQQQQNQMQQQQHILPIPNQQQNQGNNIMPMIARQQQQYNQQQHNMQQRHQNNMMNNWSQKGGKGGKQHHNNNYGGMNNNNMHHQQYNNHNQQQQQQYNQQQQYQQQLQNNQNQHISPPRQNQTISAASLLGNMSMSAGNTPASTNKRQSMEHNSPAKRQNAPPVKLGEEDDEL
ncbi:unnamed protein product [Amoebophrya sp. A120]|nr:unnamed protein product [Amoebophrya sp. A120]|eukprot:GSA120T00004715001.1